MSVTSNQRAGYVKIVSKDGTVLKQQRFNDGLDRLVVIQNIARLNPINNKTRFLQVEHDDIWQEEFNQSKIFDKLCR